MEFRHELQTDPAIGLRERFCGENALGVVERAAGYLARLPHQNRQMRVDAGSDDFASLGRP